jgi:hypothetical protein
VLANSAEIPVCSRKKGQCASLLTLLSHPPFSKKRPLSQTKSRSQGIPHANRTSQKKHPAGKNTSCVQGEKSSLYFIKSLLKMQAKNAG